MAITSLFCGGGLNMQRKQILMVAVNCLLSQTSKMVTSSANTQLSIDSKNR